MTDLDVNAFLNTSMKQDYDEPAADPEEGPSSSKAAAATIANGGPSLQDQEIGPEEARIRISFPVIECQFMGQRIKGAYSTWYVRANTHVEMLANLWTLARPHVKRAVEFPVANEPCWSEKEVPDRSDLTLFLVVRCNSRKRCYKLDEIGEDRWLKWTTQNNLLLLVYQYSHQIHSKAAWDLVVDRLLTPGATPKKPPLIGEDLRFDTLMKRLKRLHQDKLLPKTEDAFEQWARWILKSPQRRHSTLSSSMPPGEILKNFVLVKQTNGKQEKAPMRPRRNRNISGPAQREHTSDGFGFEDEVKVLRQTVTQIRDLVDMLDHRVGLLEEKCQGFQQTVQGNGPAAGEPSKKKAKKEVEKEEEEEESGSEDSEEEDHDDDDGENTAGFDDEPMVNEDDGGSDDGGDADWVNPDPLLFNDLVDVKEESIDGDD